MFRTRPRWLTTILGGGVIVIGTGTYFLSRSSQTPLQSRLETRRPPPQWTPPTRKEMINKMTSTQEFDLLVVGGGATGAGVALDAASRGLKVALVDRDDFSSGTSSKSTKLVHGGVRYLQKAVLEFDYEQYKLVREALHERKIFLQTAPYLSHSLPIMLPLYKYWQMPYYWAGCKMYDMLAGSENMESSYIMSKGKALEAFPLLKSEGLVGAMVYYDGQHNDSRMNIALVLTAVQLGAIVANYAEVIGLHKDEQGKLSGALVKDTLSGETFSIRAKGLINATGPFSDALFSLAAAKPELHKPIVQPSSGVHITLPNYYSPRSLGLIDPQTSDGRVIFFLPWQGNTIAGTTDSLSKVEREPIPREEDIQWILEEIRTYLSPDIKVRRGDVLSAWSGLRPLVRDPSSTKSGTASLVRNHLIHVSEEGLLTIAGGKWTTYRAMAAATIDRAIREFDLQDHVKGDGRCRTEKIRLIGSDAWSPNMFISLIQRFGLETEVAKHLAMNYGDRAWTVCSYLQQAEDQWPHHGWKLSPQYPFIEAEIRYAVHHEYAQTAIDFLSRRSRLSFLNARAALDALPRVIDVIGQELKWDSRRKREEYERATQQLRTMGISMSSSNKGLTWFQWIWEKLGFTPYAILSDPPANNRAIFSPGELENANASYTAHAAESVNGLLQRSNITAAIRGIKVFEEVKDKQVEYAIRQIGIVEREGLTLEDFIESDTLSLREVAFQSRRAVEHEKLKHSHKWLVVIPSRMQSLNRLLYGPTPEERVRNWQRKLKSESRQLDREIRQLDIASQKAKVTLKQLAAKGDVKSARILAKEVVRSNKQRDKLHVSKARLGSIGVQLSQQLAMLKVTGSLQKSTEIMKLSNELIKLPGISQTMREMSMEMTKTGIIEEMLQDTLEMNDDEEVEEEADTEVEQVLFELTNGKLGIAGTISAELPGTETEVTNAEAEQKMEEYRSQLDGLLSN